MSDAIDTEIEAIKTLLKVLDPLNEDARKAVLGYVLPRYDVEHPPQHGPQPPAPALSPSTHPSPLKSPLLTHQDVAHFPNLCEQKKPESAIEMAVLVAYYLSHLAPADQEKDAISTDDLNMYFKIGRFRLPSQPAYTLANAKKAGYLDSAGHGKYKLNPVGYNLVVHTMPRSESALTTASPNRTRQASRRRTNKKQAPRRTKHR